VKTFTLFIVPAIIALTLVTSVLFMVVNHPDQKIPDFLINSLTIILGYYFGVGAGKS
jgi:hypothetical protein